MLEQKFFHLDCHPVIPECRFQCARCIQEIRTVLKGMAGVSEVSISKHGEVSGVAVAFDSEIIRVADLLNALGKLPSFYKGFFVPTLIEDWKGQAI